MVYVRFLRP